MIIFTYWKISSISAKITTGINGIITSIIGVYSIGPTILLCINEDKKKIKIANYSLVMCSGALMCSGLLSVITMNPYIAISGYLSALTVIPYGYYISYY
jgi:hypothetical protein